MRSERRADWVAPGEARDRILARLPTLATERRPLLHCLGRVLAEDLISPIDLPPWDNSAMDGFAVLGRDVAGASRDRPVDLRIGGDVAAGSFPAGPIHPGTAVRVMTGAPVPEGADTVIRVEHTDGGSFAADGSGTVRIHDTVDVGKNIRRRGEELRVDAAVMKRGQMLSAARLGTASSIGHSHLEVVRRPVVGIVTSGEELVEVEAFEQVLAGRRIVSSNSYTLAAQVRLSGCEPVLLGIAGDTPESLVEHLERARGCDVLVTSAGISVGEHDHVHAALERLGVEVAFWRVRMRPGSPFAFGMVEGLGGIPWFGLPGNPVSSMVTFELFVRPALLRMAGERAVFRPALRVPADPAPAPARGLTQFLRVRLRGEPPVAVSTGPQGSGILSSMAQADALLVVPEESEEPPREGRYAAIILGGAPLREDPGW